MNRRAFLLGAAAALIAAPAANALVQPVMIGMDPAGGDDLVSLTYRWRAPGGEWKTVHAWNSTTTGAWQFFDAQMLAALSIYGAVEVDYAWVIE